MFKKSIGEFEDKIAHFRAHFEFELDASSLFKRAALCFS